MSGLSVASTNKPKIDKFQPDDDDFKHGDLGLGNGLKPGSLKTGDPHVSLDHSPIIKVHRIPSVPRSRTESVSSLSSENSDSETSVINNPIDAESASKLAQFFNRQSSSRKSSEETCDPDEKFPTYADVSYGTSIKQQKRLFEHDLEQIINKNMPREEVCTDQSCGLCSSNSTASQFHKSTLSSEIEHRLYKAKLEINELHIELENCRSRLQSKYQAIGILRRQVEYSEEEFEEVEKKSSEYSHQLEKPQELEVNSLQFSLQHQETELEMSQERFGERFDRSCQDNVALISKLKTLTEDLNRVSMENIGLKREKDELLTLVDLQDRGKYETSRSTADIAYNNYTSSELAVLGACNCRATKPDPCGCAHAAVRLKKNVHELDQQLEEIKQKLKQGERTVEVYREVFEEQLERNRRLSLKVAEVGAPINRSFDKTRHLLKWVLKTLQDHDSQLVEEYKLNGLLIADIDTTKFTDRQLLLLVIDMMNDRTDLRVHQKLASSILKKSLKVDAA